MRYLFVLILAVSLTVALGEKSSAAEGLITKASAHSASVTLDRLEAELKKRGSMIFAKVDHAAAATSVGLKMPESTVLVFGNPRAGTPTFIMTPTLAIDFPLKVLVWEDANGKIWVSYNSAENYLLKSIYPRHGAIASPEGAQRTDKMLAEATDAAVK